MTADAIGNRGTVELKLVPKLLMTPLLRQAITILQYSALELLEYIKQEMQENPLLDEDDYYGADEDAEEEDEGESALEKNDDVNWEDYFQDALDSSRGSGTRDGLDFRRDLEEAVSKPPNLTENLLWQLRLSTGTEKERRIGEEIISNINNDGYLECGIEEIAERMDVQPQECGIILEMIQYFDPVGVGSRTLSECLMVQLKYRGLENSWAYKIASGFLSELEKRQYKKISKQLGIKNSAIVEAAEIISKLEPKPGRLYDAKEIRYVIPDVVVERSGNEYILVLNDEWSPSLRVNPYYRRILQSAHGKRRRIRDYIEKKLVSAVWLIKSIEHRRRTIYRVAESILKVQREFLERGPKYLKPLTLKKIAEMIEMHESTVSRVTTEKYMQTPRGIYELKYFFSSGLQTAHSGKMSSVVIKEMIKEIIEKEDSNKPLNDQTIARIIIDRGVSIARRTVTKYREHLQILSSHKRKYF